MKRICSIALVVLVLVAFVATPVAAVPGQADETDRGPSEDAGPPDFLGSLLDNVVPDFVGELLDALPVPDFLKDLF